ncbi:sphingosine kinase 2 [Pantherophis guttatus]|uniref:sphingosine kinase n=1 Tax=Pantherophis guttatus TaxID=94885 RepID=A0A6P9BVR6_PANGU|nr:sphingosine kinase 2 [Pantherophis guttatus]XP_060548785.1 sphingosine kinase 2 [Pantherophis guttatus]
MNLVLKPCREGSEAILHGEFGAYPHKGIRYALSLTRIELHIQRLVPKPDTDQRTVIRLIDVVGCHTLRSHTAANQSAFFCIYAYPLKKKKVAVGSGRARQRIAKTFQVDGAERYKDNQALAEKWAAAIKCLVLGIPISSETEISCNLLPRSRRLLLLLNPFGGKGNALQWCQSHIRPMITEADVSFNLIQTERQNHARELVQSISLDEWDGIVAISGDGLLHEVINGLMERPDWEEAVKMPLGILPCGSGNAVAAAINCSAGFEQVMGQELLTNCTLLLCHGAVSPLDLVSITTTSGTRIFSFLSVAWGFISDVDIESEKYRHMGPARFTFGTMIRLASLNTYRGRLSYLPALGCAAHRPILRSITVAANGSLPFQRLPLHRTVSDMGLCEERQAFCYREMESAEEPTPSPSSPPSSSSFQASNFSFETLSEVTVDKESQHTDLPKVLPNRLPSARQMHGPLDDFLVPLGQPVPKSWVTVEDDFVLVLAIYQTHLGADLFTMPTAGFNDGLIHLCFIRAGISRAAMIRLFLAMEKGTHLDHESPYFTHLPVRAFRIEPLTHKGIITIDGERVEYGPIQGQIHHGIANLVTGINQSKLTTF